MKYTFFSLLLCLAFAFLPLSSSLADSKQGMGPEEIILKSTVDPSSNPRKAYFPHAQHQEKYYCSTCHHTTDNSGKKIPFDEGMKIQQCESCHNSAAASKGMSKRLTSFMKVAHLRCKGCHRQLKNNGQSTGPITCKGCHRSEINK